MFVEYCFPWSVLNDGSGFFHLRRYLLKRRMFMTESDLQELNWTQVQWNQYVYSNNKMLLWLPFGRDETIITSLNNYSNIYFKGVIDTKEELKFITDILTKPEKF